MFQIRNIEIGKSCYTAPAPRFLYPIQLSNYKSRQQFRSNQKQVSPIFILYHRFRPRCRSYSSYSGRPGNRVHQPAGATSGLLLFNGSDARGRSAAVLRRLLQEGARPASRSGAHCSRAVSLCNAATALRAGLVRLQCGRSDRLLRLARPHLRLATSQVSVLRSSLRQGLLLQCTLPRVLETNSSSQTVAECA